MSTLKTMIEQTLGLVRGAEKRQKANKLERVRLGDRKKNRCRFKRERERQRERETRERERERERQVRERENQY